MKLLTLLKKNTVLIIFILVILGLVLYMNYKPEGFQENLSATAPSPSASPETPSQYKPIIMPGLPGSVFGKR
jgi:hypothetical protein